MAQSVGNVGHRNLYSLSMFFAISNKTSRTPSDLLTYISNVLKQRGLPPLKSAAQERIVKDPAFAHCVILLLFPEATREIRCYAAKHYTTSDFLDQPDKVSDLDIYSVLIAHLRNFDSKMPGGLARTSLKLGTYTKFKAIHEEIDAILAKKGLLQRSLLLAHYAEKERKYELAQFNAAKIDGNIEALANVEDFIRIRQIGYRCRIEYLTLCAEIFFELIKREIFNPREPNQPNPLLETLH